MNDVLCFHFFEGSRPLPRYIGCYSSKLVAAGDIAAIPNCTLHSFGGPKVRAKKEACEDGGKVIVQFDSGFRVGLKRKSGGWESDVGCVVIAIVTNCNLQSVILCLWLLAIAIALLL